jgi:4-amino-4-deoxy-L-arabinose transferase-like glycosyltransferase
MRFGRMRDYLFSGVGIGLATATKYTAAIVLIPFVCAVLVSLTQHKQWRNISVKTLVALGVTAVAFFISNPYALLDYREVYQGIVGQSAASNNLTKLGMEGNGLAYYLWTFTWGLVGYHR